MVLLAHSAVAMYFHVVGCHTQEMVVLFLGLELVLEGVSDCKGFGWSYLWFSSNSSSTLSNSRPGYRWHSICRQSLVYGWCLMYRALSNV